MQDGYKKERESPMIQERGLCRVGMRLRWPRSENEKMSRGQIMVLRVEVEMKVPEKRLGGPNLVNEARISLRRN